MKNLIQISKICFGEINLNSRNVCFVFNLIGFLHQNVKCWRITYKWNENQFFPIDTMVQILAAQITKYNRRNIKHFEWKPIQTVVWKDFFYRSLLLERKRRVIIVCQSVNALLQMKRSLTGIIFSFHNFFYINVFYRLLLEKRSGFIQAVTVRKNKSKRIKYWHFCKFFHSEIEWLFSWIGGTKRCFDYIFSHFYYKFFFMAWKSLSNCPLE